MPTRNCKSDQRTLEKEPANKALKKAQKAIERDYLPRMQKYEQQEAVLEKRRSYSKTDTDATFMNERRPYAQRSAQARV